MLPPARRQTRSSQQVVQLVVLLSALGCCWLWAVACSLSLVVGPRLLLALSLVVGPASRWAPLAWPLGPGGGSAETKTANADTLKRP